MNFRTAITLALASLTIICVGCKEKEEEITYLKFIGQPTFSMPSFLEVGKQVSLSPEAVSRAEDDKSTDGLGCRWSISDDSFQPDTVRRESDPASKPYDFTFTVPDSLETITLTCTVFADGYTSATASASAIVVRTAGPLPSLQGVDFPSGTKSFTDSRDLRSYNYISVDGTDWMAENLAWKGAGYSYFRSELMDKVFGRYYTWGEAKTACPSGWTLPTNADFLALNNAFAKDGSAEAFKTFPTGAGQHMANAYFNYQRLWDYWPDVTPVNKSGFSVLPLGYVTLVDGNADYLDMFTYGMFWTDDELDTDKAYFRSFFMKYDYIICETGYKEHMAMNVRCVRKP